jgi:hypothetical protein
MISACVSNSVEDKKCEKGWNSSQACKVWKSYVLVFSAQSFILAKLLSFGWEYTLNTTGCCNMKFSVRVVQIIHRGVPKQKQQSAESKVNKCK